MADTCGYELPTNLQNFMQKDLTEVKIFLNVLGGGATFFEMPGIFWMAFEPTQWSQPTGLYRHCRYWNGMKCVCILNTAFDIKT